jgi:hypothetical protein
MPTEPSRLLLRAEYKLSNCRYRHVNLLGTFLSLGIPFPDAKPLFLMLSSYSGELFTKFQVVLADERKVQQNINQGEEEGVKKCEEENVTSFS